MRRIARAAPAAVALAVALAACAPAAEPAAPAGLRVALMQLRSDVATRQAQVRVINGSAQTVTVAGVSVTDPRFAGEASRVIADRSTTLPPGGNVDVRIQLPPAACDVGDEATPRVRLELAAGDEAGTVSLEATDPLGFLAPLHARECRAERLQAAVSLRFTGFTAAPAGEAATLLLSIEPRGGSATIVQVAPTVLLDYAAATRDGAFALDLDIGPGTASSIVALPLVPARCDPHVVQEDKRGAVFSFAVEVDGEPGEVELFAGEELRGSILTWVADWCGFGEG